MSCRVETGDALTLLREMGAGSVQCCVTSPPYWGLRDYGVDGQIGLEPTPAEYVAKVVEVFREARRVLRSDGSLWLNLGDSYTSGGRVGHGTRVGYKQQTNRGMNDETAPWRPPTPDGLKPKDLVGIPWMVAFALRADGWYLRSDIIWHKPNPMPESVTDRLTKAHEYLFLLSKSERYYYDAAAIAEASITNDARRPYGSEGAWQMDGRPDGQRRGGELRAVDDASTRNRRSVWTVATQPFPGAHFAVMPEALVEPCVLAGCPEGGTVLDPFCGSGTVGVVVARWGRRFVGLELNPAYAEMARKRIAAEEDKTALFRAAEEAAPDA